MLVQILLFISLLFVFLEFYTPGGFFTFLALMTLFSSVVLFFLESPSGAESALFIFEIVVALFVVIRFALWLIRRSANKNTFFLQQDQEGYKGAEFDVTLIGKKAIAVTDLGPSGFISVNGVRYNAKTQCGYIEKGTEVIVFSGQGGCLLVKQV